jgi:hypothetical protein
MRNPTLTVFVGDEERELPARYEVCGRCEGRGSHVNPAVDGNGLTSEDFDADPDFFEDYMSGAYDVPCECCHGLRVVPRPDYDRWSPEERRAYEDQERDRWEADAALRAEQAMGC